MLGQTGRLDLWSEDRIGPGTDREAAIRAAIADAQVAILLLSANFFSAQELIDSVLPQVRAKHKAVHLDDLAITVLGELCRKHEIISGQSLGPNVSPWLIKLPLAINFLALIHSGFSYC